MGRDWIRVLQLSRFSLRELQSVNKVSTGENIAVDALLSKYKGIFKDELGCGKKVKAHLYLKDGARPTFCKARPVPFAMLTRDRRRC